MTILLTHSRQHALLRALCIIVLLVVAIAVVYTAWIGVGNFSRIGV